MHILTNLFFRNLYTNNSDMQNALVEIKKPCKVDLNTMTPDANGRFCNVCQTSVIDFTNKTPDEIALYFQMHAGKKNCGIFKTSDIKTGNRLDNFISFLHSNQLKFVAVVVTGLLVLTGCKTKKHTTSGYGATRFLDEKTNSIENVK
ncbi:MAG: hypothetical protein V4677_03450 [Bacteroidota bacterium]